MVMQGGEIARLERGSDLIARGRSRPEQGGALDDPRMAGTAGMDQDLVAVGTVFHVVGLVAAMYA